MFSFKSILRTIAHAAVSTSVVAAAEVVKSGAPLTSGNVLVPALVAGLAAAFHAGMKSSLDAVEPVSTPMTPKE